MSANGLAELLARGEAFAASALLCGLRLLPPALLSPFLGGSAVSPAVRLALAFGLGAAAASAAGSAPPAGAALAAAAARELTLGLALGLCAALPLEAARAAGRVADTLRGAALAELHAGALRQRETAVGDLLSLWTVVLAGSAGADRLLLAALLGTFGAFPPGVGGPAPALLAVGLDVAAELAAAGLCLGAPAAAGVLCADLAIAAASRASPSLGAAALAQPARAGLGLLAVAVPAAALGGRLVQEVAFGAGIIRRFSGFGP